MLEFSIFRLCSFLCNERFTNLFLFVSYLLQFFVFVLSRPFLEKKKGHAICVEIKLCSKKNVLTPEN